MPSFLMVYRNAKAIAAAFEEVVRRWRLSPSEVDCVAGTAFPQGRRGQARNPRFVSERMQLIVEIDAQLNMLMDDWQVPDWLRDRTHPAFKDCPLDDMFGSTDRMRRIRDLLEPEEEQ